MQRLYVLITIFVVLLVVYIATLRPAPPPLQRSGTYSSVTTPANTPPSEALPLAGPSVTILPRQPVSGDCLSAFVDGQAADRGVRWSLDGFAAPAGEGGRLCIPDGSRGQTVKAVFTDAESREGSATVMVGNALPRIGSVSLQVVVVGTENFLDCTPEVREADGDPVTLSYTWLVDGQALPELSAARLPLAGIAAGSRLQVAIVPHDGQSPGPRFLSEPVPTPAGPPRITSQPPLQATPERFTYQAVAATPGSEPLTWHLAAAPPGMSVDPASGLVTWPLAGIAPGDYRVRLEVSDPAGSSAFQEFSVTVGKP